MGLMLEFPEYYKEMNVQSLEEGHFFFTSESVTEGHPDKLCELLSNSILVFASNKTQTPR
jgi:hypothetical protein